MGEIQENIRRLQEEIADAAKRAGRRQEDILLLAVTKTIPPDRIQEAMAAGLTELGENKVQEILHKYEAIGEEARWHLIGHLQTNKVKSVVGKVALIHSVDSAKLAQEIDRRAAEASLVQDVLLEVNIAREASKFGVFPENTEALLQEIALMPNIRIRGLMTVAPFVENAEDNRDYFRSMRELLVDMNAKKIHNVCMDALSMGMTGDYAVAVEEGATIVRVGTGIFGSRSYP